MSAQKSKTFSVQICFIVSFFLCLFSAGLFHNFAAVLAVIPFAVILAVASVKNGHLKFFLNPASVCLGLFLVFYALTTLWATDSGMAVIGFLRFMPVIVFALALMQFEDMRKKIMSVFPYIMAAGTVITSLLGLIPPLSKLFLVEGRLAGFLQYPNTFALLLLVAEIYLVCNFKNRARDTVCLIILIFGILYTGSRTAFVIAAAANLGLVLLIPGKRIKLAIGGALIVSVLAVVFGALILHIEILERFIKISFSSTTFMGRLLYMRDAVPLVLSHPFGTGFMGYYYLEQQVQTGVYSVMYLHNDFLQFALDIGWVPAAALIISFLKPAFSRGTSTARRIALLSIFAHSILEFNLQFIAVLMLAVLLFDTRSGKQYKLSFGKAGIIPASVLSAVSLYFGIALALSQFGAFETSAKMYPFNTVNNVSRLSALDTEDAAELSNKILAQNENVVIARSALARFAYSKGDFSTLIQTKRQIINLAPFAYEEYEDYAVMLANGVMLYSRAGNTQSAEICKKELVSLRKALRSTENRLSYFGKRIIDQPTTEFPEQIEKYIDNVETQIEGRG